MSFKPQRAHFIPKGAIKIVPHGLAAEVYIYERRGVPCAMVFAGRQQRPGLHVQYANPTRREQAVREYLDNLAKVTAYRDEQKAKRAGFKHTFKVGDVLHYSWGYDQTQCEFYEVISTTPGTITMREIGQETAPGSEVSHGMADSRTATPGSNFMRHDWETFKIEQERDLAGLISAVLNHPDTPVTIYNPLFEAVGELVSKDAVHNHVETIRVALKVADEKEGGA